MHSVAWICAKLIFIGLIGAMAVDMYVPSMPYIGSEFTVSDAAVKYSITLYLITYALGQLCFGPLSDSLGRKKILVASVAVGFLGSLLCYLSQDIAQLYVGRLLQGLGYSAIAVISPVIARDVLTDKQFAQAGSIISMIFGVGPVVSPIIGAYIDHWLGWRMVFGVIAIYTILVLFIIGFLIPESHSQQCRQPLHIKVIMRTWLSILSNKIFLTNTICKSLAYTGFIVFYTVTPFMLQQHLSLTAVEYGWVTLGLSGMIFLAKFINTLLLRYMDIDKIIYYATYIIALAGLLLLLFAEFHVYNVMSVIGPFMVFGVGAGFLFSNTTIAAFKPFKSVSSGSVSALLSGLQLLSAFVGSVIAAHLGMQTLMPLALLMALMGAAVVVQYKLLAK